MAWEDAVPQLQRRLDAEGLPGPARVVGRLPVTGYAALFFVGMAVLAALILSSDPSLATATVLVVVIAAVEALVVAWAKASVLVAGPNWIAHHGLFRWRLVRLDSLRKVDRYTDRTTAWLRLWDTEGGHIALDARGPVRRMQPFLARWVGEAQDRGVPVATAAAEMLGLPDLRTPDERRHATQRTTAVAIGLTALAVIPLLGAGAAGMVVAALLIVGVFLVVHHSSRERQQTPA